MVRIFHFLSGLNLQPAVAACSLICVIGRPAEIARVIACTRVRLWAGIPRSPLPARLKSFRLGIAYTCARSSGFRQSCCEQVQALARSVSAAIVGIDDSCYGRPAMRDGG
jgi:hypothetical protein